MHCCATKSARCPDALTITILCIGYGAYHACCYNGIVRGAFLARIGLDTDETWLCLLLLVCATGVGCLAVRALHKHGVHVTGPAGTASSYASIALFALLGLLFDSSAEVSYLLSFATGLASSIPLLVWFKSFLALYRRRGPGICMLAISVGTLLSYIPMCFAAQAQTALPQTALLIGGTLVAATVQLTFLRTCKDTPAPPGNHGGHRAEPYRLSVYIVSLVSSFGVATSLASGMAYFLGGYQSGSFSWTLVLTILCACAALTALSLLASKGATLRFGLLIRIALVAAGAVFAFAPALQGFAPNVLAALCQAVVIIQGVAMTLLSVEICHEKNLAMSDVMPANYAIYVVCVCSGMGLASMVNASGSELLWQFMMGIAITSVVAVIPALPSASSTAATFTAKILLENEGYDERSSRVCLETAARYGLTPRETDVLRLLLLGLTRAQIADKLALSSWTVKEYIGSVYNKVGVHSAKDLMIQCMAQAGTPKEELSARPPLT